MADCTTCTDLSPRGRAGGAALVFGLIVACPCHLPITAALVGAASGGAALAFGTGILYAAFSALFVGALVAGVVWMLRRRDRELALDEHVAHAHETTAAP